MGPDASRRDIGERRHGDHGPTAHRVNQVPDGEHSGNRSADDRHGYRRDQGNTAGYYVALLNFHELIRSGLY
jgi:hypothetical protein